MVYNAVITIHSSSSVVVHKNELVVTGKGYSYLLVSVVLTRSCNFERVRVDRQKGLIWPIIVVLMRTRGR